MVATFFYFCQYLIIQCIVNIIPPIPAPVNPPIGNFRVKIEQKINNST
ncbi:hypothetical protein SPLC1_S200840 [Arthrospira platensis C1]|nr:hypothetical protein SPLC1_S200840 [Arthrospira platensis C1]